MNSTLARLAVILVALLAAPEGGGVNTQSLALAVTNVTLIDGTGAPPSPSTTVIVNGRRITSIGRAGIVHVPPDAIVVDGAGKFLIPALWDMHVHVGSYQDGIKLLPRLVGYGITGVRDMASPPDDILRLRRETADSTILGPQIVAAGPILQGPLPFTLPPLVRTVTEADAAQTVAELKAKGVDFIKVGDTLTREAYFAVAAESKRVGLPFAGHLPVSVSASEVSSSGQRSIEHFGSAGFRGVLIACSTAEAELSTYVRDALTAARAGGPSPDENVYRAEFTSRLVETYDTRKATALFGLFVRNDTWQVPTFAALRSVRDGQRNRLSAPDAAAADRVWTKTVAMFADSRKAGVKTLAGSDLPVANGVPPLHDELVALVGAGMTSMEALQAATRSPAEFLGRLATEGTVEVGKKANLVLLEGNPIADISNTRQTAAVILNGRLIRGADLQKIR
jgi:imidazolonepropionase-like amidohydrolase